MKARALLQRRPPVGSRAALMAIGVVVLVGGGLAVRGDGSSTPIAYTAVQRGDVTATVGAAGTVQSAEIREVGFGTQGTVTKVYVTPGQRVAAGHLLAVLDDTPAKEELSAATATLAAARDTLDQAENPPPSPSCASGLSAAPAAWQVPAATRPDGRATTTPASPSPSPSPTRPSGSPTPTATSTAGRPTPGPRPSGSPATGGRLGGQGGKGGQRGQGGQGGCGGAGAGQQGGGGQGGQGGLPSVAEAEAQVVQAEVRQTQAERALAGTKIKAPITGTVLSVAGTVGDQVSGPGSSGFVTIGDLTELQVRAMFSQADVARLRIGQRAAVTIDGQGFAGSVTRIDPAATATGRLAQYGVMIAFDEVPAGVLLGRTATAQVTTDEVKDTLYVPSSAVRSGPGATSTVRVRHGAATLTRTVRVGVRGDRFVEIKSGLAPGDQVALS